jgi:O-antigen/teichoic acid export membrane protein
VFAHLSRLFKHSIVYGLSETISRGTGFVLMFIYVRILSESDIGTRTLVYGASTFISLFYSLGLDNAFLRYFMDREYEREKGAILSSAFLFTAVTGLVFFAGSMVFGDQAAGIIARNKGYSYITQLLFLIMVFDTAVLYPSLILRAEGKLLYYSYVSLTRFVLFIGLNLLIVWRMGRGLNGIFEANLAAVIVVALLLSPVIKRYMTGRISFPLLKKMLAFGIPTIFTLFFMRIIDISDRYLIEYFMDESAVGQYAVAYTLGMVGIMVFVNSFRTAWQPFFMSVKDNPDTGRLFAKIATYYAVFISLVFLGMTLFREEIFHVYAPGYPVSLARVIPMVAMAYVLYGFYIIMTAGVFIREKTRYLPAAPIAGAVLNLGLNILLIPVLGIEGAALTTLAAYAVMVTILFVISRRVYNVSYEYGRLATVAAVTVLTLVLAAILDMERGIIRIAANGALMLIPLAVFRFGGFLEPAELSRLRNFKL